MAVIALDIHEYEFEVVIMMRCGLKWFWSENMDKNEHHEKN